MLHVTLDGHDYLRLAKHPWTVCKYFVMVGMCGRRGGCSGHKIVVYNFQQEVTFHDKAYSFQNLVISLPAEKQTTPIFKITMWPVK